MWKPSRPITKTRAFLFLTEDVASRVNNPWDERESLRGRTKAVFDDFIENGRPNYGLFEESGGRNGIAQMKVMAPAPGIRLFGAFIHPSCFVGLRLFHRDELPFKPTGQKGRIDYKTLNSELIHEWVTLLPSVDRIRIKDL
ncbi:hypothetical protein AA0312_2908 [Acetobacter tropicalis NRIC 0312]|nr:hypothetical protein ATR1_001c0001 [Acetobacter tropicalis]GBR72414.1 hypothetical protein AA0312_2908 [Acetobacter tropicalis NRIC 0312]